MRNTRSRTHNAVPNAHAVVLTTAGQAFEPAVKADWNQPAAEVCTGEKLGTAITLYDKPQVAVRIAREQGKLVYVLQVSGNFAREEFT